MDDGTRFKPGYQIERSDAKPITSFCSGRQALSLLASHSPRRYGGPFLTVGIALFIAWQTRSILQFDGDPSLIFCVAVMAAARWGGWLSGLIAAVLAVLAVNFFFLAPIYSFENHLAQDMLLLGQLGLVSVFVSSLTASWHRADQTRLNAEVALRTQANEHKVLRALADTMPQMVWTARPDGYLDYYNDRWYEYTGMSREVGGDESWKSIIHPDELQKTLDTWYAAVQSDTRYEIEYRMKEHRTGIYRWHLGRALPVKDDVGTIVRWIGTCTDIDDQKQAEESTRQSEEQFHTLGNSIPQMTWMARPDGHIFWYNKRWYEYTGTTPEQMEECGWQTVHDPDMLPKVMERWQASIATGEPFEMTFPLRGATGQFGQFLTRIVPLKGSDGRILRWFGSNTDITDRMQMEESLRQAHDDLDARVQQCTLELTQATEGLRQNEQRYRSLIEATTAITWNTPPSGEVESPLPGWAAFTGQTQAQIKGWGWLDAIHPDDRGLTARAWSAAVATQSPYHVEHRLRRYDGEYRDHAGPRYTHPGQGRFDH